MSPRHDVIRELDFESSVLNLRISRRWLVLALEDLPDSAAGLSRDLMTDARDGLDMAIEALEEQRQ